MTSSFRIFVTLWTTLALLCARLSQSEEIIYSFEFGSLSDWSINSGTINTDYKNRNCPKGKGPCWRMHVSSFATRNIATSNYHSIRILIDVAQTRIESDESCYISYKTESQPWLTQPILYSSTRKTSTITDKEITIDDDNYNNQASFMLGVGMKSSYSSYEYCYFDNLRIYGVPDSNTNNPTSITPTKSPIMTPTKSPTKSPTILPTIITLTLFPSLIPTLQLITASIINPTHSPISTSQSEVDTTHASNTEMMESLFNEAMIVDTNNSNDSLVYIIIGGCLCVCCALLLCFVPQKQQIVPRAASIDV